MMMMMLMMMQMMMMMDDGDDDDNDDDDDDDNDDDENGLPLEAVLGQPEAVLEATETRVLHEVDHERRGGTMR